MLGALQTNRYEHCVYEFVNFLIVKSFCEDVEYLFPRVMVII